MSAPQLTVAAAKYVIGQPGDFAAFAARIEALVAGAVVAGATVVVLPEYLSLELAASLGRPVFADLQASLAGIQRYRQPWLALFSDLARRHRLYLAAGSFLLADGDGRYRNRCDLFAPDGRHAWQDKLQLTAFERRAGVIAAGDALKVVDLGGVRAGIAICYDSEFPLPVRAQTEAGARLLLVPSCTDTAAGAARVRIGCQARALENRMFVVQAVTAGLAAWSPALDVNTGEAAIYAPMDAGFPDDGVLARTTGDQPWALARLDFAAFETGRAQAQVAIDRDWPGQWRPALQRARLAGFD